MPIWIALGEEKIISGVPEGAAMSSFQGIVSLLGESECFYGGSECLREKLVCEEGQ